MQTAGGGRGVDLLLRFAVSRRLDKEDKQRWCKCINISHSSKHAHAHIHLLDLFFFLHTKYKIPLDWNRLDGTLRFAALRFGSTYFSLAGKKLENLKSGFSINEFHLQISGCQRRVRWM